VALASCRPHGCCGLDGMASLGRLFSDHTRIAVPVAGAREERGGRVSKRAGAGLPARFPPRNAARRIYLWPSPMTMRSAPPSCGSRLRSLIAGFEPEREATPGRRHSFRKLGRKSQDLARLLKWRGRARLAVPAGHRARCLPSRRSIHFAASPKRVCPPKPPQTLWSVSRGKGFD